MHLMCVCVCVHVCVCVCAYYRRLKCNEGTGHAPMYVNVNMDTGKIENAWLDSLHASFAGLQVCPCLQTLLTYLLIN